MPERRFYNTFVSFLSKNNTVGEKQNLAFNHNAPNEFFLAFSGYFKFQIIYFVISLLIDQATFQKF